jgi:hypothetical protein
MMNTAALLSSMLPLAVHLWALRLRERSLDYILTRAKECSQIVAEKGDVILHKGGKKGETAAAFNALAEGLACCSFAPGGVTFLDLHFENHYHHPETMP